MELKSHVIIICYCKKEQKIYNFNNLKERCSNDNT